MLEQRDTARLEWRRCRRPDRPDGCDRPDRRDRPDWSQRRKWRSRTDRRDRRSRTNGSQRRERRHRTTGPDRSRRRRSAGYAAAAVHPGGRECVPAGIRWGHRRYSAEPRGGMLRRAAWRGVRGLHLRHLARLPAADRLVQRHRPGHEPAPRSRPVGGQLQWHGRVTHSHCQRIPERIQRFGCRRQQP